MLSSVHSHRIRDDSGEIAVSEPVLRVLSCEKVELAIIGQFMRPLISQAVIFPLETLALEEPDAHQGIDTFII